MPSKSIGVYIKDEDWELYSENQEVLNQKAREAFEKELDKIRKAVSEASGSPQIPSLLEDEGEDAVHEELSKKRLERASERRYKTKERINKGKGG